MQNTYFKNCKSLIEVKETFRKLAKQYHPDMSEGNEETFKIINNEYEFYFEYWRNEENKTVKEESKKNNENFENYRNIINELIRFDDLTINIVGSWLWLEGNTYPVKEIIKNLNFRWSKTKKKWYYFDNIQNENKKRGFYSYNKIVEKYGCQTIESKGSIKLD